MVGRSRSGAPGGLQERLDISVPFRYVSVMPISEYTKTITVEHRFLPGQVVTDTRYTFRIKEVDAEAEEYVVEELEAEEYVSEISGVDIKYLDAHFNEKAREVVYVVYTGCSLPMASSRPTTVHRTLEAAQASLGSKRKWSGPSADREWVSKIGSSSYYYYTIAEMEVQP